MKTIIGSIPKQFLSLAEVSEESLMGKIIIIEQGNHLGLLTHNIRCPIPDRSWFFTPFAAQHSDGNYWDGCIKTTECKKFLSIFVDAKGDDSHTKVHIFDNMKDFAIWLNKSDSN